MSIENDVIVGIALRLQEAGLVNWDLTLSALPVVHVPDLREDADTAIAMVSYPISDDAVQAISTIGIQVKTRTPGEDSRTTADLAHAIFKNLHGAWDDSFPNGIEFRLIERRSGAGLGQDDHDRWVRSDNYSVEVHSPSDHRS